jgi:hypothetical protein
MATCSFVRIFQSVEVAGTMQVCHVWFFAPYVTILRDVELA